MYGLKLISKKKLVHRFDNALIYRTIDKSTGAVKIKIFFFFIFRSVIRLVKGYAIAMSSF